MKVILTVEMPDEELRKRGLDPEECVRQFREVETEIRDTAPEGTIVTLALER